MTGIRLQVDGMTLTVNRTWSPWLDGDGLEFAFNDVDDDFIDRFTLDPAQRQALRAFLDAFDDEVPDCSSCQMPLSQTAPNGGHKMSCSYSERYQRKITIPFARLKED